MRQPALREDRFARIQELIDSEVFLQLSVIDIHVDNDTLVVMTDHQVPRNFVKLLLRKVWNGPVEVFCASAIMDGSMISLT